MDISGWNDLGENLEMEIFGRLPTEDVYRYRRVCKEWKTLLSSKHFITRTWPDAPIDKQPWLVLCELIPGNPSMGFCFYTQTWKPCFSTPSFPDEEQNTKVRYGGSAAGLVLVDGENLVPQVCNPYSENSIQLPRLLAIIWLEFQCITEDNYNHNNSNTYKVVAIGFDKDTETIVQMYDCSQQRWKVLGSIPRNIVLFNFSHFVCCDSSYYCIASSPCSIVGFTIPTLNEEAEPKYPISTLVVPIPEAVVDSLREVQLVTWGSRLLVVTPVKEEEVIKIWDLE